MKKLKHFSAAMNVVRHAAKRNRKLLDRKLAGSVGRMLGAIRSRKPQLADEIARGIVKENSAK